jgi:simple sugar transport system permease protein
MDFLSNWLANIPSFAVPFALAALGLIVTEKAGVLSLGAEGFMLVGAMAAAGATLISGNPYVGLLAAIVAAPLLSLVFAMMVVGFRVNQVIAGLAIVFLSQGLTGLLATDFGWTNQPVPGLGKLSFGALSQIPVVGKLLFTQDLVVYLTVPIFMAVIYVMSRTMVGLRLRAVGDGPDAADAAGVSITLYRFGAIMAGAALMGLAGGYLSVGVAKIWVDGMSGGRGWIAIALIVFARWQPWRALAGALLFGGIEALIPRIAAAGIQVPQYFMLMTPYIVTLAVMVWSSLKARGTGSFDQPGALGLAYLREERR